jgi:hypothetical protein
MKSDDRLATDLVQFRTTCRSGVLQSDRNQFSSSRIRISTSWQHFTYPPVADEEIRALSEALIDSEGRLGP